MSVTPHSVADRKERRALTISMFGNLFMGAAGVLAAALSNSQAILVDGMFSLVGFFAAIFALRVHIRIAAHPDRHRPFGYASDEALFTTFRSLSLLALVVFSVFSAGRNILGYLLGQQQPDIVMQPVIVYFFVVGVTCFALWAFHYTAYRKGEKQSAMLKLEASAAAFDGVVTLAAGGGLIAIFYLQDGPLGYIAPIGDSLIVLFLCVIAVGAYVTDFRSSIGELAQISAKPEIVARARRAVRSQVKSKGKLVDFSVSKTGRTHYLTVYFDPATPTTASQIDTLTVELTHLAKAAIGRCEVYVCVSKKGRYMAIPEAAS